MRVITTEAGCWKYVEIPIETLSSGETDETSYRAFLGIWAIAVSENR